MNKVNIHLDRKIGGKLPSQLRGVQFHDARDAKPSFNHLSLKSLSQLSNKRSGQTDNITHHTHPHAYAHTTADKLLGLHKAPKRWHPNGGALKSIYHKQSIFILSESKISIFHIELFFLETMFHDCSVGGAAGRCLTKHSCLPPPLLSRVNLPHQKGGR